MEKARCNGLLIHFQICQNNGHTKRMDNIGLSGFAHLVFMGLCCHMVCLLNQGNII